MDGLEKLDQAPAILFEINSAWKRAGAFFLVAWGAHLTGLYFYSLPWFIKNLLSSGLSALNGLEPLQLVWLPVTWLATMFQSFNHVVTFLYVATLAFAFLATMRGEGLPRWVFTVIFVGQPLDTFLIENYDRKLTGFDLAFGIVLITLYTIGAAVGCYWWYRLREDHEE